MFSFLLAETTKLKGSLVLLLCGAAPLAVAGFGLAVIAERDAAKPWPSYLNECIAMWAYFMLPMTVTALTVLVAQMEHGPRMWRHLLALPAPHWRTYGAKALVVLSLLAGTSLTLFLSLYGVAFVAETILPNKQFSGAPEHGRAALAIAFVFLASFALVAVQLWTALRFESFVPPLLLGIVGTFVALAVAANKEGIFLPWVLPAYSLGVGRPNGDAALMIGLAGGLALFGLAIVHLSRHERTN